MRLRGRISRRKSGSIIRDISVPVLPSWVPDLSTSLEPGNMWTAYRGNETFNISKGLTGFSRINSLEVDKTLSRLRLQGYLFDNIEQYSETKQEVESRESILRILELIISILKELSTPLWWSRRSHGCVLECHFYYGLNSPRILPNFDRPKEARQRVAPP